MGGRVSSPGHSELKIHTYEQRAGSEQNRRAQINRNFDPLASFLEGKVDVKIKNT